LFEDKKDAGQAAEIIASHLPPAFAGRTVNGVRAAVMLVESDHTNAICSLSIG
jgi:hypothetical protein